MNTDKCPIIIEGVHTYCNHGPQNDYVLRDVGVFEGIDAVSGDERSPAYCLSVTLDYPPHGRRYEHGAFEQARDLIEGILQSGYPVLSARRMFVLLGVDPAAQPELDEFDARAVVQAAIWRALYPGDEYLVDPFFAQCGDELTPHAKNPRLYKAARALFERAVRAAPLVPVIDLSRADAEQSGGVRRIGPITVTHPAGCDVALSFEPVCGGYFADAPGKRITPLPGMSFYAVACPGRETLTLKACARVNAVVVLPLEDAEARPSPYQPLGIPCCVEREECSYAMLSF